MCSNFRCLLEPKLELSAIADFRDEIHSFRIVIVRYPTGLTIFNNSEADFVVLPF